MPILGSLQQDVNIVNIPIFEASVNETIALKYPLLTISNPDLQYLPSLVSNVSTLTLGERSDSQVGKTLQFNQTTQNGRTVPSEIVDASFLIQLQNDLLFVEQQTPVSISPYGTAQYIVPRTAITSNQGAQVAFNVSVQSLSADLWNVLGNGTKGSRTISTKVRAIGALSGLLAEVSITINEEFTR